MFLSKTPAGRQLVLWWYEKQSQRCGLALPEGQKQIKLIHKEFPPSELTFVNQRFTNDSNRSELIETLFFLHS